MSETPPAIAPRAPPKSPGPPRPMLQAVVNYAGLAAFLIGYLVTRNLMVATGALVAASLAALALGFALERRVAALPLFSGGMAVVFGGLTLAFHDKVFVQVKLTVIDLLLAGALLVGPALGHNPLKALLGEQIRLTDAGWRRITVRYAVFFVGMAILNEVLRRVLTEGQWVLFRSIGSIVLVVLFTLTQAPLMDREARALAAADVDDPKS